MTLRIFLRSNASTFLLAVLLEFCRHSLGAMALWLFLLTAHLLAMLWWLIQLDHADHRMLPRDDVGDEPISPASTSPPFRFVGMSEPRSKSLPANVNPPARMGLRPAATPPPPPASRPRP